MKRNIMCSALVSAPVVVVASVPTHGIRLRTIAPFAAVARRESALWLQSDVSLLGMRPTVVNGYAVDGTPKHAPRTFAPSGNRSLDPPV
ncbi:MAG: hypothetical protein ACT4QF_02260 [Sporichthyaceae bacterium]